MRRPGGARIIEEQSFIPSSAKSKSLTASRIVPASTASPGLALLTRGFHGDGIAWSSTKVGLRGITGQTLGLHTMSPAQ